MTQILLVTGFLGAGKTTLIRNVLKNFSGKTGLIVNEFGKVGFDGQWLTSKNIELIELVNGSIFCSCLEPKFIEAISQMLTRRLELLVIESSGLSDPANMGFVLSKASENIEISPKFLGTIDVIDASKGIEVHREFPRSSKANRSSKINIAE